MSVPGCRCRLYGGVVLCQAGRYCELLYLTLMLLSTDRLLGWSQGSSEDSVELRGETLHIYVAHSYAQASLRRFRLARHFPR